ncbi:hypothetical protein HN51_035456, partial [Arachis hypogaea]
MFIAPLMSLENVQNDFEESVGTLLHESKKLKSIPLLSLSNVSELDSRKRKAIRPLVNASNMNTRETPDLHITRIFFYLNYLFIQQRILILSNYNKLRTTLLEKEKQHVKRILEPTKNSWSEEGVSI